MPDFQLMKISQFRREFFVEGSRPSINTLKKWCREGILDAKRLGDMYYVILNDKVMPKDCAEEQPSHGLTDDQRAFLSPALIAALEKKTAIRPKQEGD